MLRRRREEEIVRKMLHDDSWSVEEGRAEIRGKECWRRRSWITDPMKTSHTYGFRGLGRGLGVGRVFASNKGFLVQTGVDNDPFMRKSFKYISVYFVLLLV